MAPVPSTSRPGNDHPRPPEALTPAVFHVLLALADEPRHGYAIMQAVEQSSGGGVPTGPGTIYGTLQRLEDAGLVREVAARGDERRRVFALQPAGQRALKAESERLVRLAALVRARRLVTKEA